MSCGYGDDARKHQGAVVTFTTGRTLPETGRELKIIDRLVPCTRAAPINGINHARVSVLTLRLSIFLLYER